MFGDGGEHLFGAAIGRLDVNRRRAGGDQAALRDAAAFDAHRPASALEGRRRRLSVGEATELGEVLDPSRSVDVIVHLDALHVLLDVARQVMLEISHPGSVIRSRAERQSRVCDQTPRTGVTKYP